jgi:predicted TIM-barrel fold metal-dependent hydrolase
MTTTTTGTRITDVNNEHFRSRQPMRTRVIDVDSHFGEPKNWLRMVDPDLADQFAAYLSFRDMITEAVGNPVRKSLPDSSRPDTSIGILSAGLMDHLDRAAALQPNTYDPSAHDPLYDAEGRLAFCDERGIDIQFLSPTYWRREHQASLRMNRPDLRRRVTEAWNTWAAEQLYGHTDRLIPVTQLFLADPDWSEQELVRMRELGSRCFTIDVTPVSNTKSITHPDFDRLWSTAEDLGMTLLFHAGNQEDSIHPGWAGNRGNPSTRWFLQQVVMGQATIPQLALTAMVVDGIFEAHPKLQVIVEELGFTWLPEFLTVITRMLAPHTAGRSYGQPLSALEYLQRQVMVAPLPFDPLHPTIDLAPPDMLVFSTDYPHPEGNADALRVFDGMLREDSEEIRANFFGGTAARRLGL